MPAICFEMCPDEGVGTEGSDMWTGGGSTKQGVKCQQWNLGCRHVGFTVKCFMCCSYFVVVAVFFFFLIFTGMSLERSGGRTGWRSNWASEKGKSRQNHRVTSPGGDEPKGLPTPLCGGKVG